MKSTWKLWTDSTTPEKAERVGQRVLDAMGHHATTMTVALYEKTGGHVVQFTVQVEAVTWAEGVFDTLVLAQRTARSWSLFGSILDELDAISTEAAIAGVTMLQCVATRTEAFADRTS